MRLALALLLAVAASASADAQARFARACIASAPSDEALPFDIDRVCGCAASGAMTAGTTPADLDRLMDFVQDDTIQVDRLPEALQPAGAAVMESLLSCAMSEGMAEAFPVAMVEERSGVVGAAPPASGEASATSDRGAGAAPPAASAASISAPGAAAGLPAGLRTGNGGGTVRTSAPSPGGAIRIIG